MIAFNFLEHQTASFPAFIFCSRLLWRTSFSSYVLSIKLLNALSSLIALLYSYLNFYFLFGSEFADILNLQI